MTDHKAALEHAQKYANTKQDSGHANLCRAYLELLAGGRQMPENSFVISTNTIKYKGE